MFDIGFSELLVIGIVALIVIGPERLPKVARTLGHLFGRMQRYVNDVKADISREMELEELKKLQTTMQDAARSFEHSVTSEVNAAESEFKKIAQEVDPAAVPPSVATSDQPVAAPVETPPIAPAAGTSQLELELPASAPPPEKRAT